MRGRPGVQGIFDAPFLSFLANRLFSSREVPLFRICSEPFFLYLYFFMIRVRMIGFSSGDPKATLDRAVIFGRSILRPPLRANVASGTAFFTSASLSISPSDLHGTQQGPRETPPVIAAVAVLIRERLFIFQNTRRRLYERSGQEAGG